MNPNILKNPYFYSAKMAPQKVDNLLPFKVANLMPLWRPKCGQPSASPAYIYIYIYTHTHSPPPRNLQARKCHCPSFLFAYVCIFGQFQAWCGFCTQARPTGPPNLKVLFEEGDATEENPQTTHPFQPQENDKSHKSRTRSISSWHWRSVSMCYFLGLGIPMSAGYVGLVGHPPFEAEENSNPELRLGWPITEWRRA